MPVNPQSRNPDHSCNFCGTSHRDAALLVGSEHPHEPTFICDRCIRKAHDVPMQREAAV